jgi:glutamate racemase
MHGLYYADTASVPYGDKPREVVRDCVFKGVAFLAAQGIEALVVACNTATSVAIEDLRRQYAFPIIGMEPAVKPALLLTRDAGSRVLVLATDMTLREEKFHRLVDRVDEDARVDYLSLQQLVTLAEAFDFSPEAVAPYLARATAHLDLGVYGAVVLGCTHFPFFRPHLARLFPAGTPFVDGNLGTVNNLCAHLQARLPGTGGGQGTGAVTYFESGKLSAPLRFQRYLDYCAALG